MNIELRLIYFTKDSDNVEVEARPIEKECLLSSEKEVKVIFRHEATGEYCLLLFEKFNSCLTLHKNFNTSHTLIDHREMQSYLEKSTFEKVDKSFYSDIEDEFDGIIFRKEIVI